MHGRRGSKQFKLPGLRLISPRVGSGLLLAIAAAGVVGSAWLAVQLIVNPQSVAWLNRVVPNWVPLPVTGLKPPQTLAAIRAEITQAGQMPGTPLWLSPAGALAKGKKQSDMLFPVLGQVPNCTGDCEQIVELRIYQALPGQGKPGAERFQLVDQVVVVGPSETTVLLPLMEGKMAKPGTVRSLPLRAVTRFEGTGSLPGVWLNLVGWLVRGDRTIAYGQVVHLNLQQMRLTSGLEWSSPPGTEPQWQEVTGAGYPELVVDQTLGLEPQFKIYQVPGIGDRKPWQKATATMKLIPISLGVSAIQHPAYINALLLARSGLWSPAVARLDAFKQQRTAPWTAAAQAQRDLIQRHAQVTQAQAARTWSSANQQVLVNLLDGRWDAALKLFQEKPETRSEIADLLRTDAGQIQNRVNATLKVTPNALAAKAWGALLAAVQKGGKAGAILWLRRQPSTTAVDLKKILAVVSRLQPAPIAGRVETVLGNEQVIGSAQAIAEINPNDWLTLTASAAGNSAPPLKLEGQQTWYRVRVSWIFDGKRWRSPSDLGLDPAPSALRKRLGFATDAFLQVVLWAADGQPHTLSVGIKAARLGGNGLELLAAGDAFANRLLPSERGLRALAFSDSAVQWFNPTPSTLADLVQQQPEWAKRAIPTLVRELSAIAALPPDTAPTWTAVKSLGLGNWPVQLAPITHPTQPDVVLTWLPELLPAGEASEGKPQTLIFSAAGQLLYSEASWDAGQSYRAIATLGNNGSLALVVAGASRYDLLRWSPKDRRFQD
jgi:hypothetical protein